MKLAPELKSKVDQLWLKFYSGGLSNPLASIEQMSYLLFMKRLEDMDVMEEKRSRATKHPFTSIFEGYEDCRWSEWKHMSAEKMLVHVRDMVFPFIKNVQDGEKTIFASQMKDAVFLIPKASLLKEAVTIIDELNITAQNTDVQGDIYEYLLSEIKSAGKNGQFRTPRHIIRMIIELVDPDLRDKICDPACGTAGFLINAYEHILRKHTSADMVKEDEEGDYSGLVGDLIADKREWDILKNETIYGFDFDSTMVRISLMNSVLHGISGVNIQYADTLSKRFAEAEQYTVVLANPPFKGSIDKSDINDLLTIKTTKTELLFVERMITLLQPGGRCGVIVPDGVLFSSSNAHKGLRKLILENQLEAVISMPSGVFKPYAGVSTGVLIFTKGGRTDKVWFYDMKDDGYSLDDKRTFLDGKGDIPDIIKRYRNRVKENPEDRTSNCFFVPVNEILDNDFKLNFTEYNEMTYEEIKYDPPEVILDEIDEIQKKVEENIRILRKLLIRSS
ncbi:MAG: class I SAM-dependent DNA methyltransferase [Thermoplasmata archaeon]|nr:class I SAM-dependent DNA methyltransferase [Thermoplasmata archaeon]